ncbi:MAG: substrate-binding domain-containing protein [Vallitalea sp.]|jgi:ribose transport system substrate-binding protein|nr:substrate-binding domain-containing protein [Vallitalea sp.]
MKKNQKKLYYSLIMMVTSFIIAGLIFWILQIHLLNSQKIPNIHNYKYHYMLITDQNDSSFWKEVYEGGKEEAKNNDAYLEAYGKNFPMDYEKLELLKMAIASKVDGIILEGDSSEEILQLINEADKAGIPVITALNDSYGSDRKGFVGVASYEIGQAYGEEILKLINDDIEEIVVIFNQSEVSVDQNIIFGSINKMLEQEGVHNINISFLNLSSDSEYSAEERNRSIFTKNQVPNIFVCLDESSTVGTYKAVIDFNMVGKVKIIGYSNSKDVLSAIEKGIVYSSISVKGSEIGKVCIEVLQEYKEYKIINDYRVVDVNAIDKFNVERVKNKK